MLRNYFLKFKRYSRETIIFFVDNGDLDASDLDEVNEITFVLMDSGRENIVISKNTQTNTVNILSSDRVQVVFEEGVYDETEPGLYAYDLVVKDKGNQDVIKSTGMIKIIPGQKTPSP